MEAKYLVWLLILGLISTVLAKGGGGRHHDHDDDDDHHHKHRGHHERKKCLSPDTPPELPMKCKVSEDCNAFTCSAEVDKQTVWLMLKIDPTKKTAEVGLKVPSRSFYWSHTFKSGEKIQVPGFPLAIKGVAGADMYLMYSVFKADRGMGFKLELFVRTTISSEAMDLVLLKGKMPSMDEDGSKPYEHHYWSKCHRFANWFKRLSKPAKAAFIIGVIVAFALLISGIVFCCKKRRAAKHLKVLPPSYDEATTTKTKVPMEPLVNEE